MRVRVCVCVCVCVCVTQIDTPLGESKVPDMAVLRRAMDQDLNTPIGYQVCATHTHIHTHVTWLC